MKIQLNKNATNIVIRHEHGKTYINYQCEFWGAKMCIVELTGTFEIEKIEGDNVYLYEV